MGDKRTGGRTVERDGGQVYLVLTESIQHPDQSWLHKCGTDVRARTVTQSIHDGPFPLSGYGRVATSQVPYCPTCETEPDWLGLPLPI